MTLYNSKPHTDAVELAAAYRQVAYELDDLPGWAAVRNAVGNIALLDPDGVPGGYIDVLTGDVVFYAEEADRE